MLLLSDVGDAGVLWGQVAIMALTMVTSVVNWIRESRRRKQEIKAREAHAEELKGALEDARVKLEGTAEADKNQIVEKVEQHSEKAVQAAGIAFAEANTVNTKIALLAQRFNELLDTTVSSRKRVQELMDMTETARKKLEKHMAQQKLRKKTGVRRSGRKNRNK